MDRQNDRGSDGKRFGMEEKVIEKKIFAALGAAVLAGGLFFAQGIINSAGRYRDRRSRYVFEAMLFRYDTRYASFT